jgi:predicted DNA-binding transcriptional regulator
MRKITMHFSGSYRLQKKGSARFAEEGMILSLTTSNESGSGDERDRRSRAESQLKGNTLRVYVYVVTHKKSGVREIQRALHFSSSSLAQYHLTKLLDLGLVKENGGEYSLAEQVKAEVLKDFLRVGTFIVPRFIFYAVFFTIVTAFLAVELLLFSAVGAAGIDYLLVLLLGAACGLFWYEALRAWMKGPL